MKQKRRMVVDASVILAWLIDGESGQEAALRVRSDFLTGSVDLLAPSYSRVEVANRIEREPHSTTRELYEFLSFPAFSPLSDDALIQCFQLVRSLKGKAGKRFTIYDALYVQLALVEGADLVTADDTQATAAKALGCKVTLLKDYV